ncbi:CHAP domain-containing protein [Nonomuraea sp. ATR24]|uniref:CHAP domain-containing protein n=1 Tax=Nonomuraea sp. ATR24 TaxID=1676744 RepID=UPI0035BF9B76
MTTPEMKKFIDLLESQLGYSEKAGAYTKFGDWYGSNVEFDADYTGAPWCDMFLSWAATKLGYEEWMGQFAWTVAHAKWFKRQDAWGTKPQPGAFVFYDWSGTNDIDRIDHVGVVTRVEGGRIFTIEGNIDGGVAKRKERDTSKVVGYGYPWKIKERLDEKEAQRVLKEAGTRSAEAGTYQPSEQLTTLIPRAESDLRIPLAAPTPGARTGSLQNLEIASPDSGRTESGRAQPKTESRTRPDAPATAAKPAKDAKAATAPQSQVGAPSTDGKAASAAPKPGKHAKHSTADTSAATTGPMPAIVDASIATPAAPADSTTLVTSALVAALAVLAIAKTRSLRLRPAGRAIAAVAAPPAAPAHRRRKPRKRVSLSARRDAVELAAPPKLLDAAEPVSALRSLQDTATPVTTPREPLVVATAAPATTGPFEPIVIPVTASVAPIVIPPATTPFNAFTRLPETTGEFAPIPATTGEFGRVPATTGEFARPVFSDGAALVPGGSADTFDAFDAFARPPVRQHGYAGRRRRYEHPIEEPGFAADAPPRGRRHRNGGVSPQYLEPFAQDAPLRGRRHRTAAQQARTAAHQQMALTGPPQRQSSEDTAPSRGGGARRTAHQRRGRHRA